MYWSAERFARLVHRCDDAAPVGSRSSICAIFLFSRCPDKSLPSGESIERNQNPPQAISAAHVSHRFQTIVHPTDFSDNSVEAFAHALRIALVMRSKLYFVHIAESEYEQDGFPMSAMLSNSGTF